MASPTIADRAVGVAQRFTPRGFDVIAYDSRAHGDSGRRGLHVRLLREARPAARARRRGSGPIVVIGSSLGAAVALQTAAEDRRISAVVAAESFSDLRTVARERAPLVLLAGQHPAGAGASPNRPGDFDVDEVSPVKAAARIAVPVLLDSWRRGSRDASRTLAADLRRAAVAAAAADRRWRRAQPVAASRVAGHRALDRRRPGGALTPMPFTRRQFLGMTAAAVGRRDGRVHLADRAALAGDRPAAASRSAICRRRSPAGRSPRSATSTSGRAWTTTTSSTRSRGSPPSRPTSWS